MMLAVLCCRASGSRSGKPKNSLRHDLHNTATLGLGAAVGLRSISVGDATPGTNRRQLATSILLTALASATRGCCFLFLFFDEPQLTATVGATTASL
jgi:hypothetical protein